MFSLKDQRNVEAEIAKLTGAYVNALAIGVTIVGGFSSVLNTFLASDRSDKAFLAISALCFVVGPALHWAARWIPKRELSR